MDFFFIKVPLLVICIYANKLITNFKFLFRHSILHVTVWSVINNL